MKRGKILICLACGLALGAISRADNTVNRDALRQSTMKKILEMRRAHHLPGLPNYLRQNHSQTPIAQPQPISVQPDSADVLTLDASNPYESIVKRNVFGLNPVPPSTPEADQGPPPPKITLTGITTIFGPPEALFKVASVKRGDGPPKDESYIFTEGEEQDDVEVVTIDVKKDTVTFNNHNVVQVIPLANGVASSGSAPAPAPTFHGGRPPFGRFGGFRQPGFGRPGGPGGFGGADNNSGGNSSSPYNQGSDVYNPNASSQSSQSTQYSGDDQQVVIAGNHAEAAAEGSPIANLFPPTPYDKQAAEAAQQPAP